MIVEMNNGILIIATCYSFAKPHQPSYHSNQNDVAQVQFVRYQPFVTALCTSSRCTIYPLTSGWDMQGFYTARNVKSSLHKNILCKAKQRKDCQGPGLRGVILTSTFTQETKVHVSFKIESTLKQSYVNKDETHRA